MLRLTARFGSIGRTTICALPHACASPRAGISPQEKENKAVRNLLSAFVRDEQGATAIEYGLLAAGIAVAIIATVTALGTNLNTTFSSVSTAIK
jgi:pilus assembly protein Flp/PilA